SRAPCTCPTRNCRRRLAPAEFCMNWRPHPAGGSCSIAPSASGRPWRYRRHRTPALKTRVIFPGASTPGKKGAGRSRGNPQRPPFHVRGPLPGCIASMQPVSMNIAVAVLIIFPAQFARSSMTLENFLNRRTVITAGSALLLGAALSPLRAQTNGGKLPIGTIGAGHIGSTIGGLWVKNGHKVLFSSRHPEEFKDLVGGVRPPAPTRAVGKGVALPWSWCGARTLT